MSRLLSALHGTCIDTHACCMPTAQAMPGSGNMRLQHADHGTGTGNAQHAAAPALGHSERQATRTAPQTPRCATSSAPLGSLGTKPSSPAASSSPATPFSCARAACGSSPPAACCCCSSRGCSAAHGAAAGLAAGAPSVCAACAAASGAAGARWVMSSWTPTRNTTCDDVNYFRCLQVVGVGLCSSTGAWDLCPAMPLCSPSSGLTLPQAARTGATCRLFQNGLPSCL